MHHARPVITGTVTHARPETNDLSVHNPNQTVLIYLFGAIHAYVG